MAGAISLFKHLTVEMAAVASLTRVVDHTLLTQLQRSIKLKISHWFHW